LALLILKPANIEGTTLLFQCSHFSSGLSVPANLIYFSWGTLLCCYGKANGILGNAMGASKNSEFAQMQGAGKISLRRIWLICKQEIFFTTQQLG